MATAAVKDDFLALIASILLSGRDLKQIDQGKSIEEALKLATRIWEAAHSTPTRPQESNRDWPTPPEEWGWQ
jgi:hypothetical protein